MYGTAHINYIVSRAGLMVLMIAGKAEAARSFDKIYAPKTQASSEAGQQAWNKLVERYEMGLGPLLVLEDEEFNAMAKGILMEFRMRARHEGISDLPRPIPAVVVYNN